jgi:hypothetical protein
MDVPTEHLSFFDRHTHSKVGPADMPVLQLLPTPAKKHSSSPSTTKISPSSTLSTTNFSTLPILEKSTPNAIKPKPSAVKTSSGDVEELYAFDAIIGKRKTKFGTTKGGKWKYGGNVWDYQVKWANGDITFEPETSLSTYASDAIADFEKGSIKPELARKFRLLKPAVNMLKLSQTLEAHNTKVKILFRLKILVLLLSLALRTLYFFRSFVS